MDREGFDSTGCAIEVVRVCVGLIACGIAAHLWGWWVAVFVAAVLVCLTMDR